MRLFTPLILGLTQIGLAKPLKRWGDFAVKHTWADVPHGWELYGDAPADHILDIRIGLRQDRLDELISTLYDVSDPAHQR
jgi:tripeptidyl-peptidase I